LVDKNNAIASLRYVLRTLSLVMAPSMPFYAEYLWQAVKEEGDVESVHLAEWPTGGATDIESLQKMKETRCIVSAILEERIKKNRKVRQPLASAVDLIKDEVNIKIIEIKPLIVPQRNSIEVGVSVEPLYVEPKIEIDPTITLELKAEGDVREFIRAVQDLRKQSGLEAKDRIALIIQTTGELQQLLTPTETDIQKIIGAESIEYIQFQNFGTGTLINIGEHTATVSIRKI
jgi:isoleucyl-tRNA synthetase